ncbi:MAG: peptide/nickel transport system permease protein [Nocardioidaceae bacterium]|nr:peptide/nickel transport system permease protein [Nocardioidaceae bacterium]
MTDLSLQNPELAASLEPTVHPAGDSPQHRAVQARGFQQTSRPRRSALLRGRGLVGLVLVGLVVLIGVLAPLLASYAPQAQIADANLLGASWQHPFGTDEVDRDVLSRVVYGIRTDALIVFLVVPLGAVIGGVVGLVASQFTAADVVAQRVFDVLLAFPALILAIGLTAVTGPGLLPIGCVVVAVELPLFGRLVRSATLKARELPFVEVSELMGAPRWWVLWRHILPNITEPIVVQLALSMSGAVFIESAMNFIGIGVRPPAPSLGSVLSGSIANLRYNPMYAVGPLLVIAALVLGFQLVAQALSADRRG